ncbi:MAG: hypothetical protein ACR2P2_01025 [Nakamurella sp.]
MSALTLAGLALPALVDPVSGALVDESGFWCTAALIAAAIQLVTAATVAAGTGILGVMRFRRLPKESYDLTVKT